MFQKLKQIKDLRDQAKKMQSVLGEEVVSASAAGNRIVVTIDGNLNMTGLAIDDSLLTPDKKNEMIEGIKEALKKAMKDMQMKLAVKLKDMGGLPGLDGLV